MRGEQPYIYVQPFGRGPSTRPAERGARVAAHFPQLGRTVELHFTPSGTWSVMEGPAPGVAGQFVEAASGNLNPQDQPQPQEDQHG